jgi:hypothetical protein
MKRKHFYRFGALHGPNAPVGGQPMPRGLRPLVSSAHVATRFRTNPTFVAQSQLFPHLDSRGPVHRWHAMAELVP